MIKTFERARWDDIFDGRVPCLGISLDMKGGCKEPIDRRLLFGGAHYGLKIGEANRQFWKHTQPLRSLARHGLDADFKRGIARVASARAPPRRAFMRPDQIIIHWLCPLHFDSSALVCNSRMTPMASASEIRPRRLSTLPGA